MKPENGFTMLELLIVLLLMTAVTTIVMPQFSKSMANYQLQKSTREAAAVLNESRNTAITEARTVTFEIDSEQRVYTSTATGLKYPWPDGIEIGFVATDVDSIFGSVSELVFYPDGSTSGAHLKVATASSSYSIVVDWITGQVNVRR